MTDNASPTLFADVRWVRQEDAEGCSLAVLAMLTGESYAAIKTEVDGWRELDRTHDWNTEGTSHYTLDRVLAARGWFMQRRYDGWPEIDTEPFAPIHYASVQQPSNRGHFVVVLSDGAVLDPLREGRYSLSDWPKVNQIVGLLPPADALPERPERIDEPLPEDLERLLRDPEIAIPRDIDVHRLIRGHLRANPVATVRRDAYLNLWALIETGVFNG